MDEFEKELKIGFLQEAEQLLGDTEQCFLSLETNPGDAALIDRIFRLAHNLKGSSKAVGFDSIGEFAHEFESLLLKVKNGELPTTRGMVSLLLRCNDHIRSMVEGLKVNLEASFDSSGLTAEIGSAMAGGLNDAATSPSPAPAQAAATPEAAPAMAESESAAAPEAAAIPAAEAPAAEAPSVETPASAAPEAPQPEAPADAPTSSFVLQMAPKAPSAASPVSTGQVDESIRVSLARLERLLNFVGELVILETVLQEQVYANNPLLLRKTVHQLGKVTKEVQDISMSLRMVPLKQTFLKLQRIVRDTSNSLSKRVNYVSVGDDTEVDKTVLENISDPLVHMVRNAVDHGIESAELRRERGKDEAGTVKINAFHQGGKLVIEVTDDGGGIDPQVIRKKAVEKGILREGQAITDRDALHLVFHPGFSTKAVVTEVSGRGVGMDVVKTNIEALQGDVQVESVPGKGSMFRIQLPLTLAIIDGMIIRSDGERFVIPLNHVKESFRPKATDVHWITGLGEVLKLRDDNLPLYRLGSLLGRKPAAQRKAEESIAVVVKTEGFPFAVMIDDIVGQHQVVIKKLGAEIQGMRGFSGSAILGDGRPSLILELNDLVSKKTTRMISNESRRSA